MKFQSHDDVSTRVFSYGTVPARIAAVINEDLALAQMRLANRLWNVLVAIHNAHIEAYKRLMTDPAQQRITAIKEEMTVLRGEILARRKAARRRAVDLGDLPDRLATLKTEIGVLIDIQRENKAVRHDAKKAELKALQDRTNHRIKRARQAAASMGLFWGTYNDIVQRADTGRKKGGTLKFHGFQGEGTLTAQIMGGASAERCVGGTHNFFRVAPADDGQKWRYASMRIGSNEDRSPVWLQIPIVLHRPLPDEARIKSVSMTRRVQAGCAKWQLNVVVNVAKPARKQGKVIAVDIGWRKLPEGVRVAFCCDENGNTSQVLVPYSEFEDREKVNSIKSICDRNRDGFLPMLVEWSAEPGRTLPAGWEERAGHLAQWRSSDRIARLIEWWRNNRAASDDEMFAAAEQWRKQHLHLSRWWKNSQDQLSLRLRERYRVFAAGIVREYATVVLEDFDLRDIARNPQPEEGPKEGGAVQRQLVSPSEFRAALLSACSREGVAVEKVPAEYTTRRCNGCGCLEEWDQAKSVMHRCASCGGLWDQDFNAAKNMIEWWAASGVAAR